MEFFEFVFLFSVAFVLPLTIIKMSIDYKKAKVLAGTGEGEASGVTAGDLKRFLRDAVEDANAPVLQRLDALEMAVLGDQAERIQTEGLLDESDEDLDAGLRGDAQERTLGRRVSE